jgi:hypothetical protein
MYDIWALLHFCMTCLGPCTLATLPLHCRFAQPFRVVQTSQQYGQFGSNASRDLVSKRRKEGLKILQMSEPCKESMRNRIAMYLWNKAYHAVKEAVALNNEDTDTYLLCDLLCSQPVDLAGVQQRMQRAIYFQRVVNGHLWCPNWILLVNGHGTDDDSIGKGGN